MQSGRLFRYQGVGKADDQEALETVHLEREFAQYIGARFAMGTNSCGSAMFLALKAAGVQQGDTILVNTFTLHPVPSAIVHTGGRPVFVETDENLCMNLSDLEKKIKLTQARFLLLSHMRGYIVDMDALCALCEENNITMIEDCAHGLGSKWNGRTIGTFGAAACYSAQTNKIINAGEGGLITTNNEEIAARVILYTGKEPCTVL